MAEEEKPICGEIHMIIEGSSGSVEPPEAKKPRLDNEQEMMSRRRLSSSPSMMQRVS